MTKYKKAEGTLARVAKTSRNIATVGMVASKAYKIARTVAHLVNVERKFYDVQTNILNTQFGNPGVILLLTGMAQGADYNQRNGNSVKPVSIQFRVNIFAGTTNTGYRIILYQDTEPRQALPASSDILEVVATVAPMNHVNGKRFKILKDIHCQVDSTTNVMRQHKFYKKLNGHVKYTGSAGGITTTDENNIYMYFLADTISGTQTPTAQVYTRFRYIDN